MGFSSEGFSLSAEGLSFKILGFSSISFSCKAAGLCVRALGFSMNTLGFSSKASA